MATKETTPEGNQHEQTQPVLGSDTHSKVTLPSGHTGTGSAHGQNSGSERAAQKSATKDAKAEKAADQGN